LDFLIGSWLKSLYFKPTSGKNYDQTFALNSTKADILIVGSSRASHDYISQDFEDSLKATCYNAGKEGARFLHQYAVLTAVLKRYTPKVIIWDYWEGFRRDDVNYQELSSLLPYYYSHPEIKPIINLRSPVEQFKMISKIYPYNSTLIYNLNKKINFYKNPEKDKSIKGFVPLHRIWKDSLKVTNSAPSTLDSNCIHSYRKIIAYCKKQHIQLFIVISPHYEVYKNTQNYNVTAREIADSEHIPFFDFSTDPAFLSNRKYFSEPVHLNAEGAKFFTARLIDKIKNYKSN
jgi:hypothetical protein